MPFIILLYFLYAQHVLGTSGAHDYNVDYHIGRFILGLLQVGGYVRVG